jgi:hypothetical protein
MLTVKFEQMYPEREIIGWLKFSDNDMTVKEVTENVEQHIDNNIHRLVERFPSMTELRWEFEEYGQGHYRRIDVNSVEKPTIYRSKLTFDQMTEVLKAAVVYEDWNLIDELSYQLRLISDSIVQHESYSVFELQLPMYKFDWMKTDGTHELEEDNKVDELIADFRSLFPEEIDECSPTDNGMIPTDEDSRYDKLIAATRNNEVAFEHNGQWIVNPFYDETLRDRVDPIDYYGILKVNKWL